MPRSDEVLEAAAIIRRFLHLVHQGEIEARTGEDRRMLRRAEGAAVALEALHGVDDQGGTPPH